jgi:hypothetical protein
MCSWGASIGWVTVAKLWRRGQLGWPRGFPIVQFPNPPLLLAFVGWGVVTTTSVGTVHDLGRWVFTIGLAIWAGEEATGGVNWFRRLLGVGGLVWVVFTLAGEL